MIELGIVAADLVDRRDASTVVVPELGHDAGVVVDVVPLEDTNGVKKGRETKVGVRFS